MLPLSLNNPLKCEEIAGGKLSMINSEYKLSSLGVLIHQVEFFLICQVNSLCLWMASYIQSTLKPPKK